MIPNTTTARRQSTATMTVATPTTVSRLVRNVTAPSSTNSVSDSMSLVMRLTSTPALDREKNPMSRETRCRNRRGAQQQEVPLPQPGNGELSEPLGEVLDDEQTDEDDGGRR